MIDNPIAKQKKLDELRRKQNTHRRLLRDLDNTGLVDHDKALETVAEIFEWIDSLDPQPTRDILALYNQSQDIDRNIINALARTHDVMAEKRKLNFIAADIKSASVDINTYRDFKKTITKQIHVQKETARHNTCCVYPQCYHYCHMGCGLDFSLDPAKLTKCTAFKCDGQNNVCQGCGHGHMDHRHFNSMWVLEDQKEEAIDRDAEAKFHSAKSQKAQKQFLATAVEHRLKGLEAEIKNAMLTITDLVQSYSELALGGSFVGQIEKSIRLLETNLESLRNDPGSDKQTIDAVEGNLHVMRMKLELLKYTAVTKFKRVNRQGVVTQTGLVQVDPPKVRTKMQSVARAFSGLSRKSKS